MKRLDSLPAGVDGSLIARILDSCKIVSETRSVKYTEFLDPFHREFARPLIANCFGVRSIEDGGYPGAERRRVALFPDYYGATDIEIPIAVLAVSLSDPVRVLTHRDYLGALTGLGIKRAFLGDILIFPGGANIVSAREVAGVALTLGGVSSLPAETVEVPPYAIDCHEQPVRVVKGTVASVRLDATLSIGYGIGRSKAVELVKASKVKVNWRQIVQPSFSLKAGDVITVRGRGRLELTAIGGETKKRRIRIEMNKFA